MTMKLKFLAKGVAPKSYTIDGSVINGIDTALFVEGSSFVGNQQTFEAGIFDMLWQAGVLHVVLGQMTKATVMPWAPRGQQWIDAADYDPGECYVTATNPQAVALIEAGKAETFRDTDGRWSVRMINAAAQEPTA